MISTARQEGLGSADEYPNRHLGDCRSGDSCGDECCCCCGGDVDVDVDVDGGNGVDDCGGYYCE